MESAITDIVKLFKSKDNAVVSEKIVMCYFYKLVRELKALTLEEVGED